MVNVTPTKISVLTSVTARIGGKSLATMASATAAHARPAEEQLDQHGAGDGVSEGQPDDGQHRQDGAAQRMAQQDGSFGQALGPRHSDVRLMQRVHHAVARVMRRARENGYGHHQRRQDQMAQRVACEATQLPVKAVSSSKKPVMKVTG